MSNHVSDIHGSQEESYEMMYNCFFKHNGPTPRRNINKTKNNPEIKSKNNINSSKAIRHQFVLFGSF